jgi:hypothetical protein
MLFISKISISALGNFLQRDIRESTDELRWSISRYDVPCPYRNRNF